MADHGKEISDEEFDKAFKLFKQFHARPAGKGKVVGIKMDRFEAALEVGQFYGIAYISEGKKYFHKFNRNNRPLVFVSSDGRQIYILKGGYKFTDRGFIG